MLAILQSRGLACVVLAGLVCTAGLAEERPRYGGVLRVAQRAELKTFNPVLANDAPSREVLRRLHADLITINRNTQKTMPALAESWTHSADGRQYRLKLRKGVRFSDGQPFTSADVVFSWSVYLDEAVHSPQRDLLLINDQPVQASKVDDTTVDFLFPKPYAAGERIFDSVAMLPRHKLEAAWKSGKLREAWTVHTPPSEIVGLGPFRLKQYNPGEKVELERNPYYWEKNLPYLDGIEFRLLPDEDVQLARFVSGDLDILNRLSVKPTQYLESKGAAVTDVGPSLEYNFLCFNLTPGNPKMAWFGSREFRSALSLAVDRDALVRLVYGGRATPLWGNVTPGNRLWFSEKLARPPRSIAQARAKLKTAGFHWSAAGKLVDQMNAAVEFSILVATSSPERVQMATLLQADLEELGIATNVTQLEYRSVLDRVLNTRQFDTVLLGFGVGDADPNPEMGVWLSSGGTHLWNPNQKQPATDWEAEVDTLMKRQMVTLNLQERRNLYDQVQAIVSYQSPMIFLVSPHVVVAQRGNVGNFKPAVLDHFTLWNAAELYLKPGSGR